MPRQKKENGIRILYAGQINKEKGLEHLIEAFKIVSKDFPNVALLIAGSASIWPDLDKRKFEVDKRYELEMKEKAKGGKIKFLGKLSLNELYKVYNRCDVFVLPSVIQEALPMVVLEAMASGLPIIASNVGGVPELVQHEKTGLLVKPGDLGELAEALRKLLSDERLREKMGKESYQYAEEFSIEKMTEQIYTLYEEILSK
jgi:glycosyltransferase involved in cell wall biosynthesis